MKQKSILKDNLYAISAAAIGLILFVLIASSDAENEQLQLEYYCEMVELNKNDPSVGWPDYDQIYSSSCLK